MTSTGVDQAWLTFDFHVHTPVSRCYSDRDTTPSAIVLAAIRADVDAIVVNDHHSASVLDDVRAAASDTSLRVLPGVEITTKQGHIVGLFDADAPAHCIWELLRDLDVPAAQHGNGHYMIRPRMEDVVEAVHAGGGIAVPAHVDRWPNGVMEAPIEGAERRRVLEHPALDVVEITLRETQSAWQSGRVRGVPRALACIQGSDAHSPAEVGRRRTRVRTDAATVDGLRRAFRCIEGATELLPWR